MEMINWDRYMDSLWQMMKSSTSGISIGDHANTSRFSDRNFLSWAFFQAEGFIPIRRIRSGWTGATWYISASSDLWLGSSN